MDPQTLTFILDMVLLFGEIGIAFLLLTHYRKLNKHIKELDKMEEKIGYLIDELGQHTRRVKACADNLHSFVGQMQRRKKTSKG
ncbi:MAG: hypothetical protein AB1476_00685 [Candidatus Hadarchaeota archaeon]